MSNTQRAALADVPSLTTAGKRKVAKADKSPFRIDGVTYHLARPKTASLVQAGQLLDSGDMRGSILFVAQFLQYVEQTPPRDGKPTGRAHLEQRLSDPDDDLDIEALFDLFMPILGGWYEPRPTGPRPASRAPRQASASAGSRARTRSTPART